MRLGVEGEICGFEEGEGRGEITISRLRASKYYAYLKFHLWNSSTQIICYFGIALGFVVVVNANSIPEGGKVKETSVGWGLG